MGVVIFFFLVVKGGKENKAKNSVYRFPFEDRTLTTLSLSIFSFPWSQNS